MSKSRSSSPRRGRGVSTPTANVSLPLGVYFPKPRPVYRHQMDLFSLPQLAPSQAVEDRRTFHPNNRSPGGPSPATRSGRNHTLRASGYDPFVAHQISFAEPKTLQLCLRRAARKEVLHATRKTGKTGQRRPRRNYYSSISCKGK